MQTKTINIYKFEELNPKIQEKVLNKFRDSETHPFLEESLSELLKEKLKSKDWEFENLKIGYSLSYCQGDGFNFVGTITTDKAVFKINSSNCRYSHEKSTDINICQIKIKDKWVDIEDLNDKEILKYKPYELTEASFKDEYYNLCQEMAKAGYSEIEGDLSEEVIKENIGANNYTFRENGDIERI
jgi:hypothetical protein